MAQLEWMPGVYGHDVPHDPLLRQPDELTVALTKRRPCGISTGPLSLIWVLFWHGEAAIWVTRAAIKFTVWAFSQNKGPSAKRTNIFFGSLLLPLA